MLSQLSQSPRQSTQSELTQIDVQYIPEQNAVWNRMKPAPRPCFSLELLNEIRHVTRNVEAFCGQIPDYMVWSSSIPGVFSLGGDLTLFREAIVQKDVTALTRYAHLCVDLMFHNIDNYAKPLSTISLVQGDAVGGGMEMALSSSVVIAERSARFGLPEILFGLFPGMGAYPLLARHIGVREAERFITSGRMRTASEMQEMGLIDAVVDDGAGEEAVAEFIRRQRSTRPTHRALYRTRNLVNPIRLEDLRATVDMWVECALQLDSRQLRTMSLIARSQDRLMERKCGVTSDMQGAAERPAGSLMEHSMCGQDESKIITQDSDLALSANG